MINERNLFQRKNSPYLWARLQIDGKEIRRSMKTADKAEAQLRLSRLTSRLRDDSVNLQSPGWLARCRRAKEKSGSWLRVMAAETTRRNLKWRIRPISIESIYKLAAASCGRCVITGIEFKWDGDNQLRGPYAISLDRIDSKKGYSTKNCRLVLRSVNMAMNAWGDVVFWEIANSAVGRRLLSCTKTDTL